MLLVVVVAGSLLVGAPEPPARTGGLAEEAAVIAAAFRQQIDEHLDATARARGTVLCLAVDPGGAPQSPSPEFMSRFSGEKAVRRAGECDRRPGGAVDARTLRPAIIVTIGPVEWIAADEAHVCVTIYRSARSGAHRLYRVVRERSGWISLGPILKDGPA